MLDGTATAFAYGGTGSYTYLWMPGGQTTSIATGLTTGFYTVTIVDTNGCTYTDSVFVDIISNILKDVSNSNILIYPNPTNGLITVKGKEINNIEITNISGQVVYQFTNDNYLLNKILINLKEEPKGIYFIKFQNNDYTKVKKIIIK